MELYDTHAHFGPDADSTAAVLARAVESGVARIMAIGGSAELNDSALLAHQLRPDAVRVALGADRDQANLPLPDLVADIRRLHATHACAAIGEIGLDFHYTPETSTRQSDLFAAQLALADELQLPVSIHTREADDATCGILDEVPWRNSSLRGVIHCFTGVRASARYVPDDRILIETDAPFLAPVPHRGQANEPSFIVHTARFLAELRQVSVDRLARLTWANAEAIFG